MRRTHLSHYPYLSNKECAFRRNPQAEHKFEWTDNPNAMRVVPRGYKHYIAPNNYRVYYYRLRL